MSETKAKNIFEILKNDKYVIPRYQRNYSWGKPEITQLISDIFDYFPIEDNKKQYYLGSLVCFKREDGSFELIDGQQRHTTLTLINLVIKNWRTQISGVINQSNLIFDSRKKAQNYIDKLYSAECSDIESFLKLSDSLNVPGIGSFKDAIEIIIEELRNKDIQRFSANFYYNVNLFRIEVPQDTDLNHYFEIMNNRGEQLEKHEVLKAKLMGKISIEEDKVKFGMIWDACSEMNDYIYFNFDISNRKILFSLDGDLRVDSFKNIYFDNNIENEKSLSLSEIISNHKLPIDFPKEEKYIKEKYRSIIDFPNFLLQVLKIKFNDVSLDDKKLLEYFNVEIDSQEFIFDLLKYRTLFDKYVIKQDVSNNDESKQNWGIRKLNKEYENTIKTYSSSENDFADNELEMLQVMLYYSNSTNTYNTWLLEILKIDDFELKKFTDKLFKLSKDKFDKSNLTYPNLSIFNLYYLDFLIWKLYNENVKGYDQIKQISIPKLDALLGKISNKKDLFSKFKFRQLNSREHLFSQDHAIKYDVDSEIYNGIGNLCLISTSQNSQANNQNPIDKKKQFSNDNSSLKRLIMFESFENDKWDENQIIQHKVEIEALLDEF